MMRGVLFFAALVLAPVQAGAQEDRQDGGHEALAARLVAVLPPASTERTEPDPFLVQRRADLTKRYPAKSDAVATAFVDRATCSDTRRDAAIGRIMLEIARSLSDDELRAMIAFYTGPDQPAMEKMTEDSPEWRALFARYPLTKFGEAVQSQAGPKMLDEVMAAEDACEAVLTATLVKEGIAE